MVTRGVLRNCVDPKTSTPVVLRVSGGPSVIGEDLANEDLTTSIEDAVRINASAVTMSVFIGSKYEKQTVANLAKLVDQGEAHGIPVLAVTAVGKEMARDARYLGLACRISAETGAHFVKTYYCDEFAKVVEGCPVPLVIAGGKQMKSELDVFALAHNALAEGAVGVDFGRNVWQNPRPVPMIKAIRAIVHEKHTPKEALELYNSKK
jgi:putative autoinducer-2 (AI-2) aldolase